MDVLTDLPRLAEGTRQAVTAVVLITDGYDEHSSKHIEDAIRAVKSAQATLFVVGIGGVAGISLKGERLLREVADQSGGRAFFPSRDEELQAGPPMIAADVSRAICSPIRPRIGRLDGAWRQIRVTTTNPKQRRRVRPGYFAPKPPPVRATLEFTVANLDRSRLTSPRTISRSRRRRAPDTRVVSGGRRTDLDRPGAGRQRQHERCG